MHCVFKQFHYLLHCVPGQVTVLRQKLFCSSMALCSSQNRVKKYTSQISAYYNSKCEAVSTTLMKYGFSGDQTKYIITSYPQLADLDEKSITSNIIYWFSFKMSEKDLFTSLASCPELLCLNPEFVNNRVRELLTVFTHKDILKLLKMNPEVFLEDWDVIMKKMEYLSHYMGAEQKAIVKCAALQYSLEHLRQRHLFLLFTGKFKTPSVRKKQKNPSLGIMFGKTSAFLKVTGLSVEEYIAFCEVFPNIKFENLDGSESDDESEEEDN